jgi:GxxExxY protein
MKLDILKDLLYLIGGAIYKVHEELGPGLNEYVYQEALGLELAEEGLSFEREKTFHPIYRGKQLNATYRLDFIFLDLAIIECKAVERLHAEHRAQLFNYLRLTRSRAGVLVNFAKRYVEIERYFYDPATSELITFDGKPFVIEDDI